MFELVRASNRYLDHTAPWRLARLSGAHVHARGRFENILAHPLAVLRLLARMLSPFVPKLAANLASSVAVSSEPLVDTARALVVPGAELGPARPLVTRLQPRRAQAEVELLISHLHDR